MQNAFLKSRSFMDYTRSNRSTREWNQATKRGNSTEITQNDIENWSYSNVSPESKRYAKRCRTQARYGLFPWPCGIRSADWTARGNCSNWIEMMGRRAHCKIRQQVILMPSHRIQVVPRRLYCCSIHNNFPDFGEGIVHRKYRSSHIDLTLILCPHLTTESSFHTHSPSSY